jgi:hypothetical protein
MLLLGEAPERLDHWFASIPTSSLQGTPSHIVAPHGTCHQRDLGNGSAGLTRRAAVRGWVELRAAARTRFESGNRVTAEVGGRVRRRSPRSLQRECCKPLVQPLVLEGAGEALHDPNLLPGSDHRRAASDAEGALIFVVATPGELSRGPERGAADVLTSLCWELRSGRGAGHPRHASRATGFPRGPKRRPPRRKGS